MTFYNHNLKLLAENYNTRLGFKNNKLIVDDRYFLGLRSSYNIDIIKEIIETSFDKYLNVYELNNSFKDEESSSDNEIDSISISNFKILEYEHLIEKALKGLLFMCSSSYYLKNEQEIFNDIYNKYNLIYIKLKDIRSDASLSISDTGSLNSSIDYNLATSSYPISIEISSVGTNESTSEDPQEESKEYQEYIQEPEYIDDEYVDQQDITQEISAYNYVVPDDTQNGLIVNPIFNSEYYNPDALNNYSDSEEEIVYDKHNHQIIIEDYDETNKQSQKENTRTESCFIIKRICQFCSAVKRVIHNAYKTVVGWFY